MKNVWVLILSSLILSSCYSPNSISDNELKEKVYACGIMFGDSVNESLNAHLDRTLQIGGELGETYTAGVRTIFDRLPPQDAEKGYEAYLQCIENLKVSSIKKYSTKLSKDKLK